MVDETMEGRIMNTTIQDLIKERNELEIVIADLIKVLESARGYLDPSPIIQGKIDKAIEKARKRRAEGRE
jgi:hypothetical protein